MYFQFLVEDNSTAVLVGHVMDKLKDKYGRDNVYYNIKFFKGIGHLRKVGSAMEQKTGKLLNDLPRYMRGISKSLQQMGEAAIVVVLDNDKRDVQTFRTELEHMAAENMILCDHTFCIAVKEMEAWLLGAPDAIKEAYPNARMQFLKKYEQDAICDTWEVLAEIVYPKGLRNLKKLAGGSYAEIGNAKCEWSDRIGRCLRLDENLSPSYRQFIGELEKRITSCGVYA